jgi:MFS transporter, ACS family, pantothenate transporter
MSAQPQKAEATVTTPVDSQPRADDGSLPAQKESVHVKEASVSTDTAPSQARIGWLHWHEPGTSPEEKRLILKLDWFLLSFSCLMYFIKQVRAPKPGFQTQWLKLTLSRALQLDQNNVSNAYVSGMADDLGFGPGNELSWMNTYFSIGTIVGGSFANLIITVVPPRFWLSGCLFAWSLVVLFLYKCNNAAEFYALRFLIGLLESAAWPGVMYTIGSWYRKSELARRSGLFVMSGVLGQMFSGYLQAALFKGMQGRGGLAAWRWLFIFDFILAIPVVIYGLVSN